MEALKNISKDSKTYQIAIQAFRAQFGDVVELRKLYVNQDNQVYSGEWIDSQGITNFNGGYGNDIKMILKVTQ